MSVLLRLCLGLAVTLPALAQAATLENPGQGAAYSGIGVISGWKCEANGPLTVSFFDTDMMAVDNPVSLVYGSERPDVQNAGACDSATVGFVALWNWGNLSDGSYTAIAYDSNEEFARSTFTVGTFGTAFLTGASAQVSIPGFPDAGETTTFEWNQATQHLEAVSREPVCRETLTVNPGETCQGSIFLELETSRLGEVSTGFAFTVEAEGRGCISISGLPALNYCYSDRLPSVVERIGFSVIRNEDGSWTIERFPPVDLGECVAGLTVKPGAKCRGSIDLPLGDIDFIFSVESGGRGCVVATIDVPLVADDDIEGCFDSRNAFQKVLDKIDDIIEIKAFADKNIDASWTILDLL